MAIEYKTLADGIGHVLINRPERMNALDSHAKATLCDIWRQVAQDPAIHVVVVSGAGERAFCAGSDMKEIQATGQTVDTKMLMDVMPGIGTRLDKPVIAALHGFTIGAGLTLALHCDFRIATRTTKLGFPEVKHGMLSALSAVTLPGVIGEAAALDLMLTGRTIDADEALKIGLVHRVADGSSLDAALQMARTLAGISPLAVQLTKRLILAARRQRVADHAPGINQARVEVEKSTEFGELVAGAARRSI